MMRNVHCVRWCFIIVLYMVFVTATATAQEISAGITIADTTLKVGEVFTVEIPVALHGAISIGGYISVQYDDTVLECVTITTGDMFGTPETTACSPIGPGLLRIESTVAKFADASAYSSEQIFATIAFRPIITAESTAIHLGNASQIFGPGMANILTRLDDDATQNLTTFTLLAAQVTFPDPEQILTGAYAIEWLIQNILSAPIELTLEISENLGESWELLFSDTVNPAGIFEWDTTGVTGGGDFIMRASIVNEYKSFTALSDQFTVKPEANLPADVPEPSTLALTILGLLACILWRMRRKRK